MLPMKLKEDEPVLQVGAVITFPAGISESMVRDFLAEWNGELGKDKSPFAFESFQTGKFNPEYGRPVFYVP